MKRFLGGLALCLLAAGPVRAQAQQVIVIGAGGGNSFEALWGEFRKAEAAGDAERAKGILDAIRKARVERNIRSLEPLGLAFVARGMDALGKGDGARAEQEFRRAVALDPQLPDAHFALALSQLKQGPLRFLPASKELLRGLTARLPTSRGSYYAITLAIAAGLLGVLAAAAVFGLAMVLRYATLLLHDLDESFGPGRRVVTVGLHGLLLLLPLVAFQGYGWLPLWWLALLFVYMARIEQAVAVLLLLAAVTVGPLVRVLDSLVLTMQNPLFGASMQVVEGAVDRRTIADLEAAVRSQPKDGPGDRDLAYSLAIARRKNGDYDAAIAIYEEILSKDGKDPVALNNLANILFARQRFGDAVTRYKQARQAAETGTPPEIAATIYYNLSLAHLQKFERQEADEARAQADRLAGGLTRQYDTLWKDESRSENAVVDVGLTQDQVWAKFAGKRQGVVRQDVLGHDVSFSDATGMTGGLLNRFLAFLGLALVVVVGVQRWRGPRAFTMRCQKCGTPFCKHCHLGAAPAGLCTQCFHLFVVRDGVSGPARNRKLMEVQKEDLRRERVFRAMSLLSPGSGHLYAQKTVGGMLFGLVWYVLLALVLLGGRLLPVTEAPAELAGRWTWVLPGLLLLAVYVAANRARPDFEVALPVSRGPRRGRVA